MPRIEPRGKKPNRWLIRYYVNGKGKKVRFDGEWKAAKKRAAELEAEKWNPPPPPPPPAPREPVLVEEWIAGVYAARGGRPGTRVTRWNTIVPFALMFTGRTMESLVPEDVREYVEDQLSAGNRKTGAALSEQTLLHRLVELKHALRTAAREERVSADLVDSVELPQPSKAHIETLTDAETRLWIELARGTPAGVPIALGSIAGLRRGEMIGLRRSDVDLTSLELRIRQTDTLSSGRRVKTDAGYRTVPIPPSLAELLRDQFAWQDCLTAASDRQRDDRPVCIGWDGRPLSADWLTRMPGALAIRHGLRKIRLHDLRHTYATLLLEAGVSMRAVSAYLGHTDVRITIALYGHITPRSAREARAELERVLGMPEGEAGAAA